jgi:hypothetical protein
MEFGVLKGIVGLLSVKSMAPESIKDSISASDVSTKLGDLDRKNSNEGLNFTIARNGSQIVSMTKDDSFTSNNHDSKVLLTLCTTVKNNVHFIVEWIEYMRIQGVDRFVIIDDDSTDNLHLLPKFYARKDPALNVTVTPKIQRGLEFGGQSHNLQHCVDTHHNISEWILISDTDEYLYSPSHGTLRQMLEALPQLSGRVTAAALPAWEMEEASKLGTGVAEQARARVRYVCASDSTSASGDHSSAEQEGDCSTEVAEQARARVRRGICGDWCLPRQGLGQLRGLRLRQRQHSDGHCDTGSRREDLEPAAINSR